MVTIDNLTTNYNGTSQDQLPEGCRNGDTFFEVDTGILYAYDEENGEWIAQDGSGNSNGGGSDDEPGDER